MNFSAYLKVCYKYTCICVVGGFIMYKCINFISESFYLSVHFHVFMILDVLISILQEVANKFQKDLRNYIHCARGK